MACFTLFFCMNCHLLHTILTHVSNLKKTDHCIYIEVKDTTDTKRSALYLFIHACNRQWGENKNKTLWQTQWHHFSKRQLPFHQHSSIPASPAYGVYISQLIGYNISCVQYSECLDRALLLAKQLPKQGYVAPRRKSSVQQLYDCNHNLVDRYKISISQMIFYFWRSWFMSSYNWQEY
jgi:hypothetical protein